MAPHLTLPTAKARGYTTHWIIHLYIFSEKTGRNLPPHSNKDCFDFALFFLYLSICADLIFPVLNRYAPITIRNPMTTTAAANVFASKKSI